MGDTIAYKEKYKTALLSVTDEFLESLAQPTGEQPEIVPLVPDVEPLVDKTQLTSTSTVLLSNEEFKERIAKNLQSQPKKTILKVNNVQNAEDNSSDDVFNDRPVISESEDDHDLPEHYMLYGTLGDVIFDFRHFQKDIERTKQKAHEYLLKHYQKIDGLAQKPYVDAWESSESKCLADLECDREFTQKLNILRQNNEKQKRKRRKQMENDFVPKRKRVKNGQRMESDSESPVSDLDKVPDGKSARFSTEMADDDNQTKKRMKSPVLENIDNWSILLDEYPDSDIDLTVDDSILYENDF